VRLGEGMNWETTNLLIQTTFPHVITLWLCCLGWSLELRSGVSQPQGIPLLTSFSLYPCNCHCVSNALVTSIIIVELGERKFIISFPVKPEMHSMQPNLQTKSSHSVSNMISSDRPSSIIALCRIKLNMGYKGPEKSISYQ
jgi:hypothetical protein